MRSSLARTALAIIASAAISSCNDTPISPLKQVEPLKPATQRSGLLVMPAVRISEIHYDNTGTDAGEAIEISGPAGTDVTGWSLVLYNGSGGALYGTRTLSGTIPATCGTRGVIVTTYPVNGIQNGSPDGIALVDAGGSVIEFLSYEGSFVAVGGPANAMTSTDIGVSQNGTEPVGSSLFRGPAGLWGPTLPLGTNTFGACNDDGAPPVVIDEVRVTPASATVLEGGVVQLTATAYDAADQPIAGVAFAWNSSAPAIASVNTTGLVTGVLPGDATITVTADGKSATAAVHVDARPPEPLPDVRINEIHYDNSGNDVGESIEVEGPAGTDLNGWKLVLYNGGTGTTHGATYRTTTLTATIPATCGDRGVLVVTYPANGIQNGDPDGIALVSPTDRVKQFISYGGVFAATNGPAVGMSSTDIGVKESSSTQAGYSLQLGASRWYADENSFGACNPAAPLPRLTITGRSFSDPALPVGFEDQLFARLTEGGNPVETTFTWSSDTPSLLSVDPDGVVRALGAGSAIVRVTAANGTTRTYTLPTTVATASTTAQYANNTEFGDPVDADASDDFIIRRPQFTTSFNSARGIPNWVAYEMEVTHYGPQDRCDCFTFDPELESAGFARYTTADYTGAGTVAGYGIDRGHLARSFDRTAGTLDNARTFYFSNIIPQAADNNQGPWAALESYLGDLARFQNKEVYVIAGASGSNGTVKNEGRITIPEWTWKVAVVMPRDQGLANVASADDVEVVAVILPNTAGIRNVNWETYRTSVDAVELLSGYDLLALLADDIEARAEGTIAGIEQAIALVGQLAAAGTIGAQDAKWLTLKLELAIKELDKGNRIPAGNQLEEVVRKLDGAAGAEELAETVARLRAAL